MKTSFFKPTTYWLITILVLAAVLRFDQINQPFTDISTWRESDNATIADNFYRGNWNILYPKISWNGPEPSYVGYEFQTLTYLAGLLYHIAGQHDWLGRSICIVFGLWGIFALYQLIRGVWDEQRAIVGAAIMAFLPGSIFVERSFLSDPIMVSLVTTSFWFLVVYLKSGRLRFLGLAVVIGIWGFLTKASGLIVGIPMLYAMVAISHNHRSRAKQIKSLIAASVVVLAPVVAYYLWARHIYLTYPPHHIAAAGNWIWDHGFAVWWKEKYYFSKLSFLFEHWLWTKPIILLTLLGLCLKPSVQNDSSNAPWLFHWWLFAMALYYFVGARELVDNGWNFHIVSPAGAALAAHALATIATFCKRFLRSQTALLALTTCVLLATSGFRYKDLAFGFNPYYPQTQQGYELGLALNRVTQPSDLVIAIAEEIGNPIGVYYSKRAGWTFPPVDSEAEWWDDIKNDDAAIASLNQLRQQGAQWLGIANKQKDKIWTNNPKLANYIVQTCKLYQSAPGWTIYRITLP